MEKVLRVENISAGYKDKFMLKDISFELERSVFTGIIGPNASGKTTLFKSIIGDLDLLSGRIFIEGQDISSLSLKQKAQKLAIVSQYFETPELSVEEYVLLGRYPYNNRFQFFESKKDYEIAHKYMHLTDVYKYKDRLLTELSGGAQQMVAITRALTQEPEILLLDEPTSHLDIKHQVQVLDLLRRLNKELKLSVLMILHDLNLAGQYCDQLLMMNNGAIHKSGTAKEVLNYKDIEAVYDTLVVTQENPLSKKPAVFLVSSVLNASV